MHKILSESFYCLLIGIASYIGIYTAFLIMSTPFNQCEQRIALYIGVYSFISKLVDKFLFK